MCELYDDIVFNAFAHATLQHFVFHSPFNCFEMIYVCKKVTDEIMQIQNGNTFTILPRNFEKCYISFIRSKAPPIPLSHDLFAISISNETFCVLYQRVIASRQMSLRINSHIKSMKLTPKENTKTLFRCNWRLIFLLVML